MTQWQKIENLAADDAASGALLADHSANAVGIGTNVSAGIFQSPDPRNAAGPTIIVIMIEPLQGAPGHFAALLSGDDCVLAKSRTPFCDAARKLLDLGADPAAILVSVRAISNTVSLRAQLVVAAGLTVEESAFGPVFRRHRTGPSKSGGSLAGAFKGPAFSMMTPATQRTQHVPLTDMLPERARAGVSLFGHVIFDLHQAIDLLQRTPRPMVISIGLPSTPCGRFCPQPLHLGGRLTDGRT